MTWRGKTLLALCIIVPALSALFPDTAFPEDDPPMPASPSKTLRITTIVNDAPEDLRLQIATGRDNTSILAPGRQETPVQIELACPGGTFELQVAAWTPGPMASAELRRDQRIQHRCTGLPMQVSVSDLQHSYRISIGSDPHG